MPTPILPALNGDATAPLVLLAGADLDGAVPLLREAGCRVRIAPSSAALLRLAQSDPMPQLLLLGGSVGDQSGLGLLSRLQDDPATAALPTLYVAGSDEAGDEELAVALGARDCLNLPLRPLVLLARVKTQLRLASFEEVAG